MACTSFLEPARVSNLLQDLEASGFDWTPIEGDAVDAVPIACSKLTDGIKDLSTEKRTICGADIMYDGPRDDPGTGEWYDYVTIRMLITGDGGPATVCDFQALMTEFFYKGSAGGREGEDFVNNLAHITGSLGRDVSELSYVAQATAVCAWVKKTRPIAGLEPYILDTTAEIDRRTGSPAERFETLYSMSKRWRTAYRNLADIWPNQVEDIITMTAALATNLGIGIQSEGLSAQVVFALSTLLNEFKAFAISESNEARTAEVVWAFKHADSDKKDDISSNDKAQLQMDAGYQLLKTTVENIGIDNHVDIAKALMASSHGAGILFLVGKLNHDRFWKERQGARTESAKQAVFNAAVSVTTKGIAAEWGAILPEGVANKLLSGKFTIHWWNALKPVMFKRHAATAERVDKRLASRPAQGVFSDPEALRLLESTARAVMELIGFSSNDDRSFISLWRSITRMADTIEGLPAHCMPKKALRNKLEEAAQRVMQCPQDRIEGMLATPVTAVRRVTDFVIEGSALNALTEVDGHIDRIATEVKDGLHGYARDPSNNSREGGKGDGDRIKKQKTDQSWTSINAPWGSAATRHGIHVSSDGKRIIFGDNQVVDYQAAPDLTKHCVARFAPNTLATARHKWCADNTLCGIANGEAAHDRVANFDDDKCKPCVIANAAPVDWSDMRALVKASSRPDGKGGGARGANGKGSGKGGGKGGGKGRGKGGGKGGAKGGGKGGGKGGKGFPRQY